MNSQCLVPKSIYLLKNLDSVVYVTKSGEMYHRDITRILER